MEFAAPVKRMADRILEELGTNTFNAIHLRVEDDMREKSEAIPADIRKVP